MTRSQGMISVLARLADRPDSGVRRLPEAADGEPRYSIYFQKFEGSPRVRRRVALGRPWCAGITRTIPGCPSLVATREYLGPGAATRLCWVVRLRPPITPPPARAMEPPTRSPLPLARLAAHVTQCGAIRVVAVGGDPDGTMTLTPGRIVLSPISARPRYAWSEVLEVAGIAAVHSAISQDSSCAVLWWPDMRTVQSADANALLDRIRDGRAAA